MKPQASQPWLKSDAPQDLSDNPTPIRLTSNKHLDFPRQPSGSSLSETQPKVMEWHENFTGLLRLDILTMRENNPYNL